MPRRGQTQDYEIKNAITRRRRESAPAAWRRGPDRRKGRTRPNPSRTWRHREPRRRAAPPSPRGSRDARRRPTPRNRWSPSPATRRRDAAAPPGERNLRHAGPHAGHRPPGPRPLGGFHDDERHTPEVQRKRRHHLSAAGAQLGRVAHEKGRVAAQLRGTGDELLLGKTQPEERVEGLSAPPSRLTNRRL